MTYRHIQLTMSAGRADIVLDRPQKFNALLPEMIDELADAFEQAANTEDVKCVVLSGAGANFCAGFDVAADLYTDDTKHNWARSRRLQDAFSRIAEAPVVKICKLRGYVVGAGFLLAAACQLRYACADASFYVPELDMGIPFSLGGTAAISRCIGITRTAEMILTCNKITADSEYVSGFVTRVLAPDSLDSFVDSIAASVAARPHSLLLASLSTLREAERLLLPAPASDLFTMLYVDREEEARQTRVNYSRRFKAGK